MHEMLSSEELILGVVADLHSLLNSCQVRPLLVAFVLLLVACVLNLKRLNPLWPLRTLPDLLLH